MVSDGVEETFGYDWTFLAQVFRHFACLLPKAGLCGEVIREEDFWHFPAGDVVGCFGSLIEFLVGVQLSVVTDKVSV